MEKKVLAYMKKEDMIRPGGRVIVALSGGADSVCLLSVLGEISRDPGWAAPDSLPGLRLRAVHIHHGLRGAEADRDAEFVRELCRRMDVPAEILYRDVAGYARQEGLSEEEAGRILRYEALEEAARRWEREEPEDGPVRIAVAHHQDDSAETILHHLLRGSGLRGLSGIRPVQGDRIRPLLCVRREEILSYLKEKGLDWCEDSTNASAAYTRNRIRRELIPCMTERINSRAVENILRAGEIFGQADRYLEGQAEELWRQSGSAGDGRAWISLDVFCRQEPILRTYLIRCLLEQAAPSQKDISARHLEMIDGLAFGQAGKRCDLPGGVRAVRGYETLRVECSENGARKAAEASSTGAVEKAAVSFQLPGPGDPPLRAGDLEFRVFLRDMEAEIPKKQYTKWFDYDKIKGTLSVRGRQTGDYLTLPGGSRKTVRRYMIDEKIPRERRGTVLLLAEGDHVLWVVGGRISEYYKVTEDTHRILQVDFYEGGAYGR